MTIVVDGITIISHFLSSITGYLLRYTIMPSKPIQLNM